jgi:cytochrome b subunit of formate dehydrogenase
MRNRKNSNQKKERQFAWLIAGVIICVCAYRYYNAGEVHLYWLAGAFALVLIAIWRPSSLSFPLMIWEKIGYYLALINTTLLLTIIYFLIFLPLGLLFRLTGRDLLGIKLSKKKSSYWEVRDNPPASLKHQF